MVIQPSAAIKSLLKQSGLFVGGENPVSKSFSHGYILYTNYLKVKDYFIECGQLIPQLTQGVFLPDKIKVRNWELTLIQLIAIPILKRIVQKLEEKAQQTPGIVDDVVVGVLKTAVEILSNPEIIEVG